MLVTGYLGAVLIGALGDPVGGWRTVSGGPTRPSDRCGR